MDSESQFVCQRSWQKFVTTYTHWFPSVIKTRFRKKREAHVLFRFPRTSLESFLHLWSVLQDVYFPLFHFYELVVKFNPYELGLITSICACLGMADFGTYNKSHGPPRKNTEHPDFHLGWSVGRPRILVLCSTATSLHTSFNHSQYGLSPDGHFRGGVPISLICVKSLQLIWRSGLQMSCNDLTKCVSV